MREKIVSILQKNSLTTYSVLRNDVLLITIEDIVLAIVDTFRGGGKVLLCGNGGSAADAQHIAAEFSGRFYFDRDPLFAEALHVNTSYLTAVANDYGYDEVYSRLVKAKGRKGDVLMGLSTSGNSVNVVNALKYANGEGIKTIGFTGEKGGDVEKCCNHIIKIPSTDTPRIQEAHILVGHIICELVENKYFSRTKS